MYYWEEEFTHFLLVPYSLSAFEDSDGIYSSLEEAKEQAKKIPKNIGWEIIGGFERTKGEFSTYDDRPICKFSPRRKKKQF